MARLAKALEDTFDNQDWSNPNSPKFYTNVTFDEKVEQEPKTFISAYKDSDKNKFEKYTNWMSPVEVWNESQNNPNFLDEQTRMIAAKKLLDQYRFEQNHPVVNDILNGFVPFYRAGKSQAEFDRTHGTKAGFFDILKEDAKQGIYNGVVGLNYAMALFAPEANAIKAPLSSWLGKKIASSVLQNSFAGGVGGFGEGFARGLETGENPIKLALTDMLSGTVLGGATGLGIGKIRQQFAKKGLQNADSLTRQNYFDDYIDGLNNQTQAFKDYGKALKDKFKAIQDVRAFKTGFPIEKATEPIRIDNFIGKNAQGIDLDNLQNAKNMFANGIDNETVRQSTGWFKGVDGKLRYEIPSGNFNYDINWNKLEDGKLATKLANIYDAPDLYNAYPELANIDVVRASLGDYGMDGSVYKYKDIDKYGILLDNSLFTNSKYSVWKDKINKIYKTPEGQIWQKADEDWWNNRISDEEYEKIYNDFMNTEIGKEWENLRNNEPKGFERVDSINSKGKEALAHEIQHLIQEKENFARGGTVTDPNYARLAGEVEARTVSRRLNLSDNARKKQYPFIEGYTGYDIAPEKQIVKFDGDSAASYKDNIKNGLNYRDEWIKIDGKDYHILNLPKKNYGKIMHIIDTNIKQDQYIGEVISKPDDMYSYTFQKVSPTEYKFIGRKKLK